MQFADRDFLAGRNAFKWMREDFSTGRRSRLQFQGVGAHPWLLEGRNGLARGIYNRPATDDRGSSKQILTGVQHFPDSLLSPRRNFGIQDGLRVGPRRALWWGGATTAAFCSPGTLPRRECSPRSGSIASWRRRPRRRKLRRLLAPVQLRGCQSRGSPQGRAAMARPGGDSGH